MKKFFAILLLIALLLPMGVIPQASAAQTKPFYLVNWKDNDVPSSFYDAYSNVYYLPFFYSNAKWVEEDTIKITCPTLDNSSIEALAESLKELMDTFPEGARYINFSALASAMDVLAEVCFVDKVVPVISQWLDDFLKVYKDIGGKLDGFVIDTEFLMVYNSYIHNEYYQKDPKIYYKLTQHSTYINKIRPQLVERDFKFYDKVTELTPELYSIYPNSGSAYDVSRAIWDTVMKNYANQCVTEACAPLWKYYPNASVSDYQCKSNYSWLKNISDRGGTLGGGGNYVTAGNCSNENFYFNRPGTSFFDGCTAAGYSFKSIPAYNETFFKNSTFNRFLYDIFTAKNTYLAAEDGNVSWWLDPYDTKTSKNPYYAETVFHLGMLNPVVFQGYILMQDCDKDEDKYDMALTVVNDCLKELTRVVGAADRKPIYVDPNWNHNFVLSGMYAGGKNIWRLTPDYDQITLADFKVEGADPTFCVDGETITFPQGKIIDTGKITDIGTNGYWIETPADVMPVVTRTADYYRNFASFAENYEDYDVGMEYTYNNVKLQGVWEMQKAGGGTGTVVADPTDANNKVLALKNTYTLKNVMMPQNVTAGDTYAEHQAWEVSFTLPADMNADGELILLNAGLEKKKIDDGGFKIAGGKVYYYKNGEYVELAGVTLSPGTRYTVVREVDFSTADAFNSDFYVYGADGALLGKAMNVPMDSKTAVPIYSVSIGAKNIAGEAVLLDDYKLYPTKVAADFYLYDAKTGMRVTEVDQAREGDTAYRLSWLNAAQTEKTYTVMVAYYDGETKVSEEAVEVVKMAPNADGILTGIVENKNAGKTMLVYLRDDNPAEPEEDDTPNATVDNSEPADTGDTQNDSKLIVIAVAAVVIIAAVVAVVLFKKKKTAKAPKENTEE